MVDPTRTYLIRIVSEPDEHPIVMTQREFDVMLDIGAVQPEPVGEKVVAFATVETSDDGPFLHHGQAIPDEVAADWTARALVAALHAATENRLVGGGGGYDVEPDG